VPSSLVSWLRRDVRRWHSRHELTEGPTVDDWGDGSNVSALLAHDAEWSELLNEPTGGDPTAIIESNFEHREIGEAMKESAELRRRFLAALRKELRVVWPILSGLVGVQLVLGMLVGFLEGWRMSDAAYFTFITGLTIGYGDLVPVRFATRLITVVIGFSGSF
jgi:hypothetical protein